LFLVVVGRGAMGETGGMDEVEWTGSARAWLERAAGERVRRVWRGVTGAVAAFREVGWVVAAWPDDGRRIGVVRLGDAGAVSAPAELLTAVGGAVAGSEVDLTDPQAVVELLGVVVDVAGVRGPAVLAYADSGCFRPLREAEVATVGAGDAGVVGLAAACGVDDADESSIARLTSPLSVIRAGGQVVAASGYEVWSGELAHVGVLTHPRHRGRGLGTAVAGAAVAHALTAGLVPQWRARATITASRRIARSLGFVEVGRQLSVQLRR
jgi:GNAT superfamily N-acetyltransferase